MTELTLEESDALMREIIENLISQCSAALSYVNGQIIGMLDFSSYDAVRHNIIADWNKAEYYLDDKRQEVLNGTFEFSRWIEIAKLLNADIAYQIGQSPTWNAFYDEVVVKSVTDTAKVVGTVAAGGLAVYLVGGLILAFLLAKASK